MSCTRKNLSELHRTTDSLRNPIGKVRRAAMMVDFMDKSESEGDRNPDRLKAAKARKRHDNRVAAMQFLYMYSSNAPSHLPDAVMTFLDTLPRERDYYAFAEELIYGALEHLEELDEVIRSYAENWKFSRIAKVDLAVLRLALHELMRRQDIPPVVTINEAIEIAKEFSGENSGRFINGILDRYKSTLTRPLR